MLVVDDVIVVMVDVVVVVVIGHLQVGNENSIGRANMSIIVSLTNTCVL